MFIPDGSFKNIIFQELEKSDKSISSLHRSLKENGHKVHRLVLTGYLKAMEEMGFLVSRDFPPSKVYSISATAEKDIYETVGIIIKNMDRPEETKPEIGFYFFQKLFRRPIFKAELERVGFDTDPEGFAVRVSNEERLEVKRVLAKRNFKLPHKNNAYLIVKAKYDEEFEDIMQQLILVSFKAQGLSMGTKQTKLV